ncbi:MAG: tRNA (N(6)-L-threonylcarbamoyladenosine(37)-C(2))-methylthiotransferase MtaB, partial [Bacillales bacterium]|nr:tRNA (N(6)-L-threonylcarbamoyladenosine(37)-C(2))-methylthiotransferase MtaB [Bacillales bacterium]
MTFNILTLGCKVNTYESNYIEQLLIFKGYQKVNNLPDIVIINTCSVTSSSDSKSRQLINRVHRENPKAILVVLGCYSQKESAYLQTFNYLNIISGTAN